MVVAAWSGLWVYARQEAAAQLDAAAADLRQAGYELSWSERRIGGYPFRLNLTLTEARVRESSGWALAAPRIEAQAFLHGLGTWVIAAPEGLTFVRPVGGAVAVQGETLRASLSQMSRRPPNISFQGINLAFVPAAGAQPFALSAAEKVEFHLRAGPDDQAMLGFRVDQGQARLSGLFARVADGGPVSIVWDSILSKVSAFSGESWPAAVRAWSAAGGVAEVRQAGVTAGEAVIGSQSGRLTVGYDGRLRGVLDVSLREAPRALAAMGDEGVIPKDAAAAAAAVAAARQEAGPLARATLNFEAGRTTLGPVAVGPAPRIY